jgi:hypothetical protein
VYGTLSPDLVQQLAVSYHLPSVMHQCGQEFVFDRGEVDRLFSTRRTAARQVDLGCLTVEKLLQLLHSVAMRSATRMRASNSPIPNGLVT